MSESMIAWEKLVPTPQPLLQSFFMGGFEGSSHRRADGRQLDLLAATGHDRRVDEDYGLLSQCGIRTIRDAFRWHLIETSLGQYDWSSILPMIRAARATGMQLIWDLCHYGVPHDLNIWSSSFVDRFARFAAAASRVLRDEGTPAPFLCPVNEISYWAWAGGDHGRMYPSARGRGPALKRQLARAAIAATHAVRTEVPDARFVMAEPLIHVVAPPEASRRAVRAVATHGIAQFEDYDMVAGRLHRELGGSEDCLDLVGVNYYPENQFFRAGPTIPIGHWLSRPFRHLLADVHARYARPLLVTETGAKGGNGPGWLRYVAGEVRAALRRGVPVEGLCLYPVMDYPGWADDRPCRCGLVATATGSGERSLNTDLLEQLREEDWLLRHGPGTQWTR